jgi:hypothetical protein
LAKTGPKKRRQQLRKRRVKEARRIKEFKVISKGKAKKVKEERPPQIKGPNKLSQIVGSKQQVQTQVKGSKESQTIKTTKESEPFKPKDLGFQESNYERLRQWIEREGLDREEAESKMVDAGQPMTRAQQRLLDEFEDEGTFSGVENDDYIQDRLTA